MGTPRSAPVARRPPPPEQKSRGGRTEASRPVWFLRCGKKRGRCRTAAPCLSAGPGSAPSRGSILVRTRRPSPPL
eukprot:5907950-Prymnesium_polylepis.1